jgi:hypothetical protein
MWRRVALVRTDDSEERFVSIIRMKRIGEIEVTWAGTNRYLQVPHDVTSQKTAFKAASVLIWPLSPSSNEIKAAWLRKRHTVIGALLYSAEGRISLRSFFTQLCDTILQVSVLLRSVDVNELLSPYMRNGRFYFQMLLLEKRACLVLGFWRMNLRWLRAVFANFNYIQENT